ncbi:hypothetical protein LTR10_006407 [Elasticomyces elasticus]|nr:hypothetical protein LTR10_006407 [Elasticomyces elasticus]
MTSQMREALKGNGGPFLSPKPEPQRGLQSISSSVGETIGNGVDMQTSKQKGATAATDSLKEFGKGAGTTTEGTSVSGADQVKNMQTGTADHLDMGLRKS